MAPESMKAEQDMVSSCMRTRMLNDSDQVDESVETIVHSLESYFTWCAAVTGAEASSHGPKNPLR